MPSEFRDPRALKSLTKKPGWLSERRIVHPFGFSYVEYVSFTRSLRLKTIRYHSLKERSASVFPRLSRNGFSFYPLTRRLRFAFCLVLVSIHIAFSVSDFLHNDCFAVWGAILLRRGYHLDTELSPTNIRSAAGFLYDISMSGRTSSRTVLHRKSSISPKLVIITGSRSWVPISFLRRRRCFFQGLQYDLLGPFSFPTVDYIIQIK